MENNQNPTQPIAAQPAPIQVPVVNTAPAPQAPGTPAAAPSTIVTPNAPQPSSGGGGMGKMLWIIVAVVLAVAIAGGAYLYMQNQNMQQKDKGDKTENISSKNTQQITTLESEIGTLDVGTEDENFSDVDLSLQNL